MPKKNSIRAQQELDQNNVLSALACLERALSIWDDPLWHSRLGFCIAKQRGQLTRAFELCRSAIENDPGNPLHYLYLGKVHLVAGNAFEALQAFRQGMKCGGSPSSSGCSKQLGPGNLRSFLFFHRDNLLNKFLGIILARFGLR